jgi:hypothetical protein
LGGVFYVLNLEDRARLVTLVDAEAEILGVERILEGLPEK